MFKNYLFLHNYKDLRTSFKYSYLYLNFNIKDNLLLELLTNSKVLLSKS